MPDLALAFATAPVRCPEVPSRSCLRESRPPPPARRPSDLGKAPALSPRRSPCLDLPEAALGWLEKCSLPRSAGNRRSLAPGGIPSLLETQVSSSARKAKDRSGTSVADPEDGHRKPALGRSSSPRLAAQARARDLRELRLSLDSQVSQDPVAELERLPREPRG